MKRLTLVLLTATAATAISLALRPFTEVKQLAGRDIPRIINGDPVSAGEVPWQVAAYITKAGMTVICGGSLVSTTWVLTAAHCIQGQQSVTMYFGAIDLRLGDDEGRVIIQEAEFVIPHENYNPANANNDIAVLGWTTPITLTDRIQLISLPTSGEVLQTDVYVTASGFGYSNINAPATNILLVATLRTITNNRCKEYYGNGVIIDSSVCVVGNTHQGPCVGDSGGPLVATDDNGAVTLVGVTSIGLSRCATNKPYAYVRTESFLDWINSKISLVKI